MGGIWYFVPPFARKKYGGALYHPNGSYQDGFMGKQPCKIAHLLSLNPRTVKSDAGRGRIGTLFHGNGSAPKKGAPVWDICPALVKATRESVSYFGNNIL